LSQMSFYNANLRLNSQNWGWKNIFSLSIKQCNLLSIKTLFALCNGQNSLKLNRIIKSAAPCWL
jgi:hypothetical protein